MPHQTSRQKTLTQRQPQRRNQGDEDPEQHLEYTGELEFENTDNDKEKFTAELQRSNKRESEDNKEAGTAKRTHLAPQPEPKDGSAGAKGVAGMSRQLIGADGLAAGPDDSDDFESGDGEELRAKPDDSDDFESDAKMRIADALPGDWLFPLPYRPSCVFSRALTKYEPMLYLPSFRARRSLYSSP